MSFESLATLIKTNHFELTTSLDEIKVTLKSHTDDIDDIKSRLENTESTIETMKLKLARVENDNQRLLNGHRQKNIVIRGLSVPLDNKEAFETLKEFFEGQLSTENVKINKITRLNSKIAPCPLLLSLDSENDVRRIFQNVKLPVSYTH